MKPQAYTEFQPLEEVLIGRNFDSKIVDDWEALPKVKSLLKKLLDETEKNDLLSNLKKLNFDMEILKAA